MTTTGLRAVLIAGCVLALLVVSACGGSSSKRTTTQPDATTQPKATTKPNATTSAGGTTHGAGAHVDLTVSGGVKFHITGTKATCNGLGDGVDLAAADYPEVGQDLHIGAFSNGRPDFKWLYKNNIIYASSSRVDGLTFTTHPFKAVMKGTNLVAAVPIGTPAKPGVMLTGTITCPS